MLAVPADGRRTRSAGRARRLRGSRRHSIRMWRRVCHAPCSVAPNTGRTEVGNGSPNMSFFTGQARAHGFQLEGYGVFFHVEIPEMQTSLVLSVTTLERDMAVANALESVRRAVGSVPEGAPKIEAETGLKRLEVLVGPSGWQRPRTPPKNMIRASNTPGVRPAGPARSKRRLPAAIRDALIDASLNTAAA